MGGDSDEDTQVSDAVAELAAAPTQLADVVDTQGSEAWSLCDEEPETRVRPWWITGAAVAASLAVVGAAAWIAMPYLRGTQPPPTPIEPVAVPVTTTALAPPSAPAPPPTPPPPILNGPDGEFIAEMKGFGVPISDQDPQWTIDLAHAVCATAHDPGRPPGTHTVILLTEGVMENNPDWTRQQASRLTNGAVKHYCPEVWGPSQEKIASMPPDARYLAMLQDRLGITAVDDSLVQAAHQICARKAQGWSTGQVVDAMNSPNGREDEWVIVETAVNVYCPRYAD